MLIWHKCIWLSDWKLSRVEVTELTIPHNLKKSTKKEAEADEETLAATEEEQEAPVLLVTHEINILHSIFSFLEMYVNSQKLYNSNGFYAHFSYTSNNFKGTIS